jgi:2-polyprenyl-6-methoxyphenol hydroxylase-like FAD-dependent oxidoreductase
MQVEHQVLIVGAGIGGTALARALATRGISFELYERAAEVREVGAGIVMQAGAMLALRSVGLDGEVLEAGREIERGSGRAASGKVLHSLPLDFLRRELGAPMVALHRARLQRVLLGSLEPERVHLGKELERVEQRGSSVVVHFADGTRSEGTVLVGADGLRSRVRTEILGESELRYSGYSSYRGIARGDGFAENETMEIWGRGARFGIVPIGHGETYWFAVVNAPENERSDDPRGFVLSRFASFMDPVRAVVEATPSERILRTDIHDRVPISSWSRGRVTLLGDAAHPTTPNLGQGGCMAIEDAVTLAHALASQPDVGRAFALYEDRRVARTARIVEDSFKFGKIAQLEGRFSTWLRDLLLVATPESVVGARMLAAARFEPSFDDRAARPPT